MITINIKNKDNFVNYIKISGHANYAEEGFDIVCASVSSISITTINAIIKIDSNSIKYSEEDGLLEVEILKNDKTINLLIDNMISMFKSLEKQYKKYIKIR